MAGYPMCPVTVVFKTSSRANAKVKIKTFLTKKIDDILDPEIKVSGLPSRAVIEQIGVGNNFEQKYKEQFGILKQNN